MKVLVTEKVSSEAIEPKKILDEPWGEREGQFGSSNPLTTKPVLDEPWGNRETQR